ncbi:unnamed protein product [Allacma fusca]|uniref:Uncharacterized protein n=1 Tax=Allacma fusca TaxID=39272 RepID=A0A8J2NVL1_9HEXA|nr:unnamed protein product [Allacma fusca]
MLIPRLCPGIWKDRAWINNKNSHSIFICSLILCLINSSTTASMTFGPQKNSFGDSIDKESGWTPMANQMFSHRQQESRDRDLSAIIAHQRAWLPQPSFPSHTAKSTVLPGPSATAPIPSATRRPIPVSNDLKNHAYRRRPTSNYPPPLRQKPMINHRRKNNKKIIPSLFLQKVARKVFFPDRRADKERSRGPKPKLRFENSNKVQFPVRNSPIQNISNRLRQYLQPVICAFRTESVGLEGERCVQV